MFPKIKFKEFCTKYNIVCPELTNNYDVSIQFKNINIEHITSNPLDEFLYINFNGKDYNETNFQYKPFKHLYTKDWLEDDGMWYNYESAGEMTVPLPLHLYTQHEYSRLFTNKTLSPNNTITTTIPFNTIEQLEHLYTVVYPKLHKDIKDFYNSEAFQNTLQTYKDNLRTIRNLKKGTVDLLTKSYSITKKKAEIEDEFTL